MVTKAVHKQIRGFVIIWLAITFIVVIATFLAIYFTSDAVGLVPGSGNPFSLPQPRRRRKQRPRSRLCRRARRHSPAIRRPSRRPNRLCRSFWKRSR